MPLPEPLAAVDLDPTLTDYEIFMGLFGNKAPSISGLGDLWDDVQFLFFLMWETEIDLYKYYLFKELLILIFYQAGLPELLAYLSRSKHLAPPGRWVRALFIFKSYCNLSLNCGQLVSSSEAGLLKDLQLHHLPCEKSGVQILFVLMRTFFLIIEIPQSMFSCLGEAESVAHLPSNIEDCCHCVKFLLIEMNSEV